jgi:hypothetical protein
MMPPTMHPSMPSLPDDVERLVAAHLDDCLSPEDQVRLDGLVSTDPAVAAALARAALLHDRLHDVFRDQQPTAERAVLPAPAAGRHWAWPAIPVRRAGLLAAAVAATLAMLTLVRDPAATAAVVALDRIVAAIEASGDREYRVVVDPGSTDPSAPPVLPGGGRKPPIAGASLFVRGPDQFVLVRRFGDGSEFLTGSDGRLGWAVPPRGHVHLSRDTRRFRRGVPGEHEDLPFLDLRSGCESLRRGYDLSVATAAAGSQVLRAVRRGDRRRGPEAVSIWFDAAGVATRIEIGGLAAQDGLPRAVALELVSQRPLGGDFFGHAAHHGPDRPIDWE